MSRRVPVLWMVVSLAIILTMALTTPIAQADPAHQDSTSTPELSIIEAAAHLTNGVAAYTELFDTPKAYAELTAAIEADPQLWDAYLWRARLYYEVGALDLALADVNVLLQNQPENIDGLILRAKIYAGPFQLDLPISYQYAERFGYVGFGRYQDLAMTDIEVTLRLDPENPVAWLARGQILMSEWIAGLYTGPGLQGEAGFEYLDDIQVQAFASFVNSNLWGMGEAELSYWLGFLYLLPFGYFPEDEPLDDREAATAMFEEYLNIYPITPHTYKAKSMIAWLDLRPADAIAELQAGITQFPNYAPLQAWLSLWANMLDLSPDVDNEAIAALVPVTAERAVELAPYSPPYLLMQAIHDLGDDTVAQLEDLLQIVPNYPPALAMLARYYVNDATRDACQRASELSTAYQAAALEYVVREVWKYEFGLVYARNCLPPTPTPLSIPVTDSRIQVGDTITLPGVAVFPLKSEPEGRDGAVFCTSGTEATVLQVIRLENADAIYVQLECDAGIGWIEEVLLK